MKLSSLRRETSAALQKANEDLTAVEAEIVRLQQEHLAKLLDAEVSELDAISHRIGDLDRQANYYRERIARFEAQLEVEKEEQRKRAYVAAVTALAGSLENVSKLARRLEKNDAERAALVSEYDGAIRGVLKSWDSNVEFPVNIYPPGYVSVLRLGERLRVAQGYSDLVNRLTRQAPLSSELVARATRPYLHGFGDEVAAETRQMFDDLRTAQDPILVEDETTKDEVAA